MSGYTDLVNACNHNINFFTLYLKEVYDKGDKGSIKNLIKKYEFYLAATILELSVTLKNIVLSNSDWEKIFFTKNSFLIIFESTEHFKNLSQNNHIKNFLKKRKQSCDNLDSFSKSFDEYLKSNDFKLIENVRNIIAAHFDDSVKKYYDTCYSLNGEKGALLTSQYLNILQKGFHLINQLNSISK